MTMKKLRFFLAGFGIGFLVLVAVIFGGVADRLGWLEFLNQYFPGNERPGEAYTEIKVLKEESVVIDVVEKSAPSVVTVSISKAQNIPQPNFDPFGFFNFETEERRIERNIGSGFVPRKGLVITNKHVVNDLSAEYRVIDQNGEVYEVSDIYRDPVNDLAILKVDSDLQPIDLGSSENLQVGQLVVAIGTALGEFRHTVTTGVISGLGRGITAGSVYEGYVERLDDVIQTDAAINPGNSGGPLINSVGQVIGVNVAVAGQAENIGFAIPIDVVKESLEIFEETGEFKRAFLGVEYQMISERAALLNEVPQGAYVGNVVEGSSADRAGLQEGDIITHLDGKRVAEEENKLAEIINKKKVGDEIEIKYWRKGEEETSRVKLGERE
jgi:serine protease Do